MERYRNIIFAIFAAIATIIAALTANLVASKASSWTSISLVVGLSIITIGLGIFQVFSKAVAVREKKTQEQSFPIKITLQIDREPITVETTDTERVKEILKLMRDLQAHHPSSVNAGEQKSKIPEDSEHGMDSEEHLEG